MPLKSSYPSTSKLSSRQSPKRHLRTSNRSVLRGPDYPSTSILNSRPKLKVTSSDQQSEVIPGPRRKMDPQQRITPQAKQLSRLASYYSIKSRSWVTGMLLVVRTGSCRLWIRAKGIHSTAWLIVLLLPAVPAGFSIKYSNQAPAATFTSNLIAMVPLGAVLTLVTDELIVRRGGHEALLVVVTTGFVTSPAPEIAT